MRHPREGGDPGKFRQVSRAVQASKPHFRYRLPLEFEPSDDQDLKSLGGYLCCQGLWLIFSRQAKKQQ